jgi:hypothetical protein
MLTCVALCVNIYKVLLQADDIDDIEDIAPMSLRVQYIQYLKL